MRSSFFSALRILPTHTGTPLVGIGVYMTIVCVCVCVYAQDNEEADEDGDHVHIQLTGLDLQVHKQTFLCAM